MGFGQEIQLNVGNVFFRIVGYLRFLVSWEIVSNTTRKFKFHWISSGKDNKAK